MPIYARYVKGLNSFEDSDMHAQNVDFSIDYVTINSTSKNVVPCLDQLCLPPMKDDAFIHRAGTCFAWLILSSYSLGSVLRASSTQWGVPPHMAVLQDGTSLKLSYRKASRVHSPFATNGHTSIFHAGSTKFLQVVLGISPYESILNHKLPAHQSWKTSVLKCDWMSWNQWQCWLTPSLDHPLLPPAGAWRPKRIFQIVIRLACLFGLMSSNIDSSTRNGPPRASRLITDLTCEVWPPSISRSFMETLAFAKYLNRVALKDCDVRFLQSLSNPWRSNRRFNHFPISSVPTDLTVASPLRFGAGKTG